MYSDPSVDYDAVQARFAESVMRGKCKTSEIDVRGAAIECDTDRIDVRMPLFGNANDGIC